MSHNFINDVPYDLMYKFLQKTSNHRSIGFGYLEFSIDNYRKSHYMQYVSEFLEEIKAYYKPAKKKYVTRPQTYPRFMTVIRQICIGANIPYTTKIYYANNTYYIIYYIKQYIGETELSETHNSFHNGEVQ